MEKFRSLLTYCFDGSAELEKNIKKHCVIKKNILHLQPENHQGVLRESSCKRLFFEVEKMF